MIGFDTALGIVSGALKGLLVAAFLASNSITRTAIIPPDNSLSGALYQAGQAPPSALTRPAQRESASTRPAASPDTMEQAMLAMVNQERKKRDLVELRWDDRLATLAEAHSKDMLAKNYFAHEDPRGRTAADRAAKAGIVFMMIGENLAFAKTLSQAHDGLMKSPGHRENILRPEFRRVGIGIIRLPPDTRYLPKQAVPAGRKPKTGGYLLITQIFAR